MKNLLALISGAVLASASLASATTVTVANAVPVAGANATYQDSGFVWKNEGGFGSDCQGNSGNRQAATLYMLDNLYGNESCGAGVSFQKSGGGTFSVSSLDIDAADFTRMAPSTPSPAGNARGLESWSFNPYAGLDSSGVDVTDFAAIDAYVQAATAQQAALVDSYLTWVGGSTAAPKDPRFYVSGRVGGAEVVRQYFADTGGRKALTLSGFSDIDELVVGFKTGNFLWDNYSNDFGYHDVLAPSQLWCAYECEEVNIFGFSQAASTAIASVPVPASGALLLAGLGLMGWRSRKAA